MSAPPPAFVDTHCHLDASEFDADRDAVKARATDAGVVSIVIPAIAVSNFATVAQLAATTAGGAYALGIHPLCTPEADKADIAILRHAVEAALADPRFVALGEIGLDFFVAELATSAGRERQTWFYHEQLKIARDFELPVLLHVRRAQDAVLAGLRRIGKPERPLRGIAHAFNGSRQQANQFVGLGLKLGFGGAMTWERALRIRALAADLPGDTLVLETDAPDIAPAWLHHRPGDTPRNAPFELPRIAATLAALRDMPLDEVAAMTTQNARAALPRLASLQYGSTPTLSLPLKGGGDVAPSPLQGEGWDGGRTACQSRNPR